MFRSIDYGIISHEGRPQEGLAVTYYVFSFVRVGYSAQDGQSLDWTVVVQWLC